MFFKSKEKIKDDIKEIARKEKELAEWQKFFNSIEEGDEVLFMGNKYKVASMYPSDIFHASKILEIKYHDHRHRMFIHYNEIHEHLKPVKGK